MELLIIAIGFTFVYFILLYVKKNNKKRRLEKIKDSFGKKPLERKFDSEKLSYYWNELKKNLDTDEYIDSITWNDLEMDKVFSRINSCYSSLGEQLLYSKLHILDKRELDKDLFEKKINHFANNSKEREGVQLLFSSIGCVSSEYYLPRFISNLDMYKISNIFFYKLMQILLILPIIATLIFKNPQFLLISSLIFLINVLIYTFSKLKYEVELDMLSSVIKIINLSGKISNKKKYTYAKEFEDLDKNSKIFKKISFAIAVIQMKKEAALSGDIIGLMYDYIIGATLWDFTKYNQIINMLDKNKTEFNQLYEALGEIDASISIVSFRKSLPFYCEAKFEKNTSIKMTQIYHPLIDNPVCNSLDINRNCIITGSNASGKSTYMKALAVNVILAQSINTCMAKEFIIPKARLTTSMAVRDDLMTGESYYIKEIKYLKRIIDDISQDRLLICIIDEILRGTNTEERIAASASILKYLHNKNCIAIVASHDYELTQLLDKYYDNYHFTEKMINKDIIFDYKIYQGSSNSKNAIKLLGHIGFPNEIISNAESICERIS